MYPLPNGGTTNHAISLRASSTGIRIYCGADWTTYTGYVTLEYTKQ